MTDETRAVRIPADLAEMIEALRRHEQLTSAELLDPIIRRSVGRLFDKLPDATKAYFRERIARLTQPAPAAK